MNLYLTHISNQGSLILINARNLDNGNRVVVHVPFTPYFYASPVDADKLRDDPTVTLSDGYVSCMEDPVVKVVTETPQDVNYKRRGKTHLEADVPFTRRFLIDTGIHAGFHVAEHRVINEDPLVIASTPDHLSPIDAEPPPLNLHRYDIETGLNDRGMYAEPDDADAPITVVTWHDSATDTVHSLQWHPGHDGDPVHETRERFVPELGRTLTWHRSTYEDEPGFLLAYLDAFRDAHADALVAWNGHYGFKNRRDSGGYDAPFIIHRLDTVGINSGHWSPFGDVQARETGYGTYKCRVEGVQLIDLMTTFSVREGGYQASVPSHALKDVVEAKTDLAMHKDPASIVEWWMHDNARFLEYSFQDVVALVVLDEQERYTDWIWDLARFSGVEDVDKVFTPTVLVDTLILRNAKTRGVVLPSGGGDVDVDFGRAKGAYVIEPPGVGRVSNVLNLDVSAMYPSIIQAANIGMDTLVPEGEESPDDIVIPVESRTGQTAVARFRHPSKKQGLTPEVITQLRTLRAEYDAKIEASDDPAEIAALRKERRPVKEILLVAYGYMLNPHARLHHPFAGAAVTALGREMTQSMEARAKDLGLTVIYGDSDSLLIQAPTHMDPVNAGEWVAEQLAESFQGIAEKYGLDDAEFSIDFESLYGAYLQGDEKKNYAGLVTWSDGAYAEDPVFVMKGVEAVKNNSPALVREAQTAVIRAILDNRSMDDVEQFVRSTYESVLHGKVSVEDVATRYTMNFPVTGDYQPNAVSKGAKRAFETYGTRFMVGERCYTWKSTDPVGWVSFPVSGDIPGEAREGVDWTHMAKNVLGPLTKILRWVGEDDRVDAIRHGRTVSTQTRLW